MKKTFLAIASAAIVSISALFSGCSGFVMSETKEIDEISAKTLTDGSTQITITYVDNLYDPVVFTIPKGQQGVAGPTGNGIATFEEVVDPVTSERSIVVTFTDPSHPEKVIPIVDGKDGVSIVDVKSEPREDGSGELDLVVYLSNDTTLRMPMPSGKDGDQVSIVPEQNSDGTSLLITITKQDGTTLEEQVVIPRGEQGVGLTAIQSGQTETEYFVTFYLSDGTSETQFFTRPNTWLQDVKKPDDSVGIDGDFCFDTLHDIIYLRENGSWVPFLDFGEKMDKYSVEFVVDLNDERGDVQLSGKNVYSVTYGTFASNGYNVPTASLDGYEFLGWYTTREPNLIINGAFNDLTFVASNMKLYPLFREIVE